MIASKATSGVEAALFCPLFMPSSFGRYPYLSVDSSFVLCRAHAVAMYSCIYQCEVVLHPISVVCFWCVNIYVSEYLYIWCVNYSISIYDLGDLGYVNFYISQWLCCFLRVDAVMYAICNGYPVLSDSSFMPYATTISEIFMISQPTSNTIVF